MSEIVVHRDHTPQAAPQRLFSVHGIAERVVHTRLRWAGLEERVLDLDRARVRVWVGGSGPPLMLLHGFGGDGAWAWHPQVRDLARRHTLIVPDLVWFGGSHSEVDDPSLHFQAEVAASAARALGHDRHDLAGISYGGLVAFTFAASYHDQVRRLVLVDSPGPIYGEADHQRILTRFGVTDVAEVVIPTEPAGVRRLLELAWTRPPPTPHFVLRETFERVFSAHVPQKRKLLSWLDEQRRLPELRPDWTVPQPTLLVWGEHDPLFPLDVAHRLRDAISGSELRVIADTRHAPNLEKPRVFNELVLDFLGR